MTDRLVLLGTKGGPAIRQGGAMPTSSFLEIAGRKAVIDCGLGVARGLVEAGEDLRALDLVFITHLHSDHLLELGALLHTAWTTGLNRPVTVHGPAGTRAYWQAFMASMAFDTAIRVEDEGRTPLDTLVTVREYGEGEVLAGDGLTVTALRVDHPPVIDCFALRFDGGGHAVTFSADTRHFPPLADFARGSDILVHEAMLTDGVEALIEKTGLGDKLRQHLHNSHSTAADAARVARAADAKHLVLNHLIPADDPRFGPDDWLAETGRIWNGLVTPGRDGLEIPLSREET
ncbi:MAG: MBL fold metallo-hydrolase [Paracoccaceae bacterium]